MAKQETTISVDISSFEFRAIRVSAQNLEAGGRQRPGPNNFLMIDAQPSRCPNSTLMIRFRVIIFRFFAFSPSTASTFSSASCLAWLLGH